MRVFVFALNYGLFMLGVLCAGVFNAVGVGGAGAHWLEVAMHELWLCFPPLSQQ